MHIKDRRKGVLTRISNTTLPCTRCLVMRPQNSQSGIHEKYQRKRLTERKD